MAPSIQLLWPGSSQGRRPTSSEAALPDTAFRRRFCVRREVPPSREARVERRAPEWLALLSCASSPGGMRILIRSEEHTSELQSLMRISYAVFCLKKKKEKQKHNVRQAHTTKSNTTDNTQEPQH